MLQVARIDRTDLLWRRLQSTINEETARRTKNRCQYIGIRSNSCSSSFLLRWLSADINPVVSAVAIRDPVLAAQVEALFSRRDRRPSDSHRAIVLPKYGGVKTEFSKAEGFARMNNSQKLSASKEPMDTVVAKPGISFS